MSEKVRRRPGEVISSWHHHSVPSSEFETLRGEIIRRAAPRQADQSIDLGAGTGALSLRLAETVERVIAVESSREEADRIAAEAAALGLANVATMTIGLANAEMPRGSVDLVVSSYACHHLHHADKRAVAASARRWLREGGRLVIGDMMTDCQALDHGHRAGSGRSATARGRGRIGGPGGRILRTGLHMAQERPATAQFWLEALRDAGFPQVGHRQITVGSGVVWAKAEQI